LVSISVFSLITIIPIPGGRAWRGLPFYNKNVIVLSVDEVCRAIILK
jgi:hypothetical protein